VTVANNSIPFTEVPNGGIYLDDDGDYMIKIEETAYGINAVRVTDGHPFEVGTDDKDYTVTYYPKAVVNIYG
jgi:hypothetical protein